MLGKREKHSFITNTGHKANYQERYFIDNDKYSISKPYIVKHSKNIIDLIEVGDYVNGVEIDEFDDVEGNVYLGFPIYDDALMNCISEFRPLRTVEIKSIVTKEQFASMEYKVKE